MRSARGSDSSTRRFEIAAEEADLGTARWSATV